MMPLYFQIPPQARQEIKKYEQEGVAFEDLSDHMLKLKTQKPNGFACEFFYVEEKTFHAQNSYENALKPFNKLKNRYSNVLAVDKTRVVLSKIDDDEDSDYINANFIDGLIPGSEKTYVATQGPLPNTFGDFWRMVWELNSCVIVMLTKEVENGRLKCERYWPEKDDPFENELFKVILEETNTNNPELTIRTFKIENLKENKSRKVFQFQYTAWPDHGLPPSTRAFIELMHDTEEQNKTNGPIIVHCSAGIGRSGVFCVCHSTMVKLKYDLKNGVKEPKFNMLKVILHMRAQRPGMVQTKEQYEFCYLAINEEARKILGMEAEETDESSSSEFEVDDDEEN